MLNKSLISEPADLKENMQIKDHALPRDLAAAVTGGCFHSSAASGGPRHPTLELLLLQAELGVIPSSSVEVLTSAALQIVPIFDDSIAMELIKLK